MLADSKTGHQVWTGQYVGSQHVAFVLKASLLIDGQVERAMVLSLSCLSESPKKVLKVLKSKLIKSEAWRVGPRYWYYHADDNAYLCRKS